MSSDSGSASAAPLTWARFWGEKGGPGNAHYRELQPFDYPILLLGAFVLSWLHFAVGLGVATGINRWHRAAWPWPPRDPDAMERERPQYALHLFVFVPIICVAYVLVNLGLRHVYDGAHYLAVRWWPAGADARHRDVHAFLGSIAVILGFAWGSSVSLYKTGYLLGDYGHSPIVR